MLRRWWNLSIEEKLKDSRAKILSRKLLSAPWEDLGKSTKGYMILLFEDRCEIEGEDENENESEVISDEELRKIILGGQR